MSYLNVITLAEAKNYLRVDNDLTDDDDSITAMIESALYTVELETRIFVYAREKQYYFRNGCARVYDFPINSVVSPTTDLETETKTLYTNYTTSNLDNEVLTLNVGYSTAGDVPSVLKQYALYLVELYYYDSKGGDKVTVLPKWIKNSVNQMKRFVM